MVVTSFAIGVLGQSVFYCGFVDGILTVLFFNLLGVLTVCFFSIFGAEFGLRQMVVSRFWFGWWGVKLSMADLSARRYKTFVLIQIQQSPSLTCSLVSAGRPQTRLLAPN